MVSTKPKYLFDSPNEASGGCSRCLMENAPKVTHHKVVDFSSDEEDLLDEYDCNVSHNTLANMRNRQEKFPINVRVKRIF